MRAGYDVAIIGAGLVGCAAAYELARRGRSVGVLDQGEMNRGASGRNAGSLHFQLEPRMLEGGGDPRRLAQLLPVSLQAIEDWRRLPEELHRDLELAMHGGLMVAETDAERDLLARKCEVETRGGLPVRVLEGAELRRAAPYLSSRVRCASFCAAEGHANPRFVTPAYAAAARAHGAEINTGTRLCALEPRSGGWRLRIERPATVRGANTNILAVDAELVLIAAGAWSREIVAAHAIELPLEPVALGMNVTERCAPVVHHLVQHVGRRLSIKQVAAGNVLIGGGWPAAMASLSELGPDPRVRLRESSIIGNVAVALEVVPQLAALSLIRSWTGIACVSPDHLPVLGPISGLPGVFIAAGGSSFTLGPTYARLVSELMAAGQASMPLQLYRPDRFQAR
ncbi:MAG: NAD(P)/FAD-dependent oxidoreductase [Steroidobacteraceae bacterium]